MEDKREGFVLRCPVYDADDYTVYISRQEKKKIDDFLKRNCKNNEEYETYRTHEKSFPGSVRIKGPGGVHETSGRVLACSCYGGRHWSLTFRKEEISKAGESGEKYISRKARRNKRSNYKPRDSRGDFLNSILEICNLLFREIFRTSNAHGLIVVTGRTGSAKSQVVRGLIHGYLTRRLEQMEAENLKIAAKNIERAAENKKAIPQSRRPHLLTFEDPIEKYYFADEDPQKAQDAGLDYTPREKSIDADSLKAVVRDALRQTPTILFVGETRNTKDWHELIRFAGTGHLVFTTAHAGSLTEAMGNIFKATGTKSATSRSDIADKLFALIHIRTEEVSYANGNKSKKILLPALWRNTPIGAKALMAEGRASLLPQNPDAESLRPSSIGRSWFAKELWKSAEERGKPAEERSEQEELRKNVMKTAIEWDIEGG